MRKVEKKKLDAIGKALIKAAAPSPRDFEQIVANPSLFDSVRMRIALADPERPVRRSLFRPLVAAFSGIVVVTIAVVAFVALKQDSGTIAQRPMSTPPKSTEVRRSREPDRLLSTKLPPVESSIGSERIPTRSVGKNVRPKQRSTVQRIRQEGDFYAVSYAGDPNETERGGRILRVDIPRSTLFAMGVDIPLENDAQTVKADLLIGNDGVTRAIRVVE